MYKVWLDDQDIIQIVNEGAKTPEEQQITIAEIRKLSGKLRSEQKRVLILDDISKMEIPSEALRKVGAQVEKMADFDKFALFSSDQQMRIIVKFMIMAGGEKKLKIFTDRNEAMAWLAIA